MGRFLLLVGFVLIIIAVGMMIVMLQDPAENTLTAQVFNLFVCQGDEKIQQELGNYVRTGTSSTSGWGRELTFYCINSEDQQRDVTLNAIVTIAGAFAIPFVSGLIMTMVGSFMMIGRFTKRMTSQILSGSTPQFGAINPIMYTTTYNTDANELTDEHLQKVKSVLGNFMDVSQMNMSAGTPTPNQQGDLATRLEQLEDARRKGLISQSEYERTRQSLLENFGE